MPLYFLNLPFSVIKVLEKQLKSSFKNNVELNYHYCESSGFTKAAFKLFYPYLCLL